MDEERGGGRRARNELHQTSERLDGTQGDAL